MAGQGLAKVSHIIYISVKFCIPKDALRVLERKCLCLCTIRDSLTCADRSSISAACNDSSKVSRILDESV